jgi:Putative prokaryotic signal transducing protein
MDELVEVYVASDITFAYLVKAQLEGAEIPVHIANENVSAVYNIDGMVPRVLVPAPHAEQARQIIAEMQQAPPPDDDDLDDEDDE